MILRLLLIIVVLGIGCDPVSKPPALPVPPPQLIAPPVTSRTIEAPPRRTFDETHDRTSLAIRALPPHDFSSKMALIAALSKSIESDGDLKRVKALGDAVRAEAEMENESRFETIRAFAAEALAGGDLPGAVAAWDRFKPIYDPAGRWQGMADREARILGQSPPESAPVAVKPEERRPGPAKVTGPLRRPEAWAGVAIHDIRRVRHLFPAAVGPDPRTRTEAQQAIAWHGKSFPREMKALVDAQDEDGMAAALALAYSGDPRVALKAVLASGDFVLRSNAIEASKKVDTRDLEAWWACGDLRIALAAARTAARQSESTLQTLRSWARSPHSAHRDLYAAYALTLKDPLKSEPLVTALASPLPARSALAFRLLADLAMSGAIDPGDITAHARKVAPSRDHPSDTRLLAIGLLAETDGRSRDIVDSIARAITKDAWGCEDRAAVVLVIDDSMEPAHLQMLAKLIAWSLGRTSLGAAGALRVGVVALAEANRDVLEPTMNPIRIWEAIDAMSLKTTRTYRNTMQAVRQGSEMARREANSARNIVLYTLENGDVEDDLEKTCAELIDANARFYSISSEAMFADPYWKRGAVRPAAGGYELEDGTGNTVIRPFAPHGPESAFVEFPFGWWFQENVIGDLVIPSGLPYFGLARMARVTGGTGFTWAPKGGTTYGFCARAACPCGDHDSCMPAYSDARLNDHAPLLMSRAEVLDASRKDPLCIAMRTAWQEASEWALVSYTPNDGGPVHARSKGMSPLHKSIEGRKWAMIAAEEAERADRTLEIMTKLEKAVSENPGALPRSRAMAEIVALYLAASRLNTLELQRLCLEKGKHADVAETDARLIGRVARTMCHGGRGLVGPGLTGNDEWTKFGRRVDAMIAKYKSTPWEVLARRVILIKYEVYIPPPRKPGPLPNDPDSNGSGTGSRPASETEKAPTPGSRPSRDGHGEGSSGSTGSKGGTTSD